MPGKGRGLCAPGSALLASFMGCPKGEGSDSVPSTEGTEKSCLTDKNHDTCRIHSLRQHALLRGTQTFHPTPPPKTFLKGRNQEGGAFKFGVSG